MQKIALLYDASQAVLSTFELDEVLAQILQIIRDYFQMQNAGIFLWDPTRNDLYLRTHFGRERMDNARRFRVGEGLIGTAARLKRPVYVPDVEHDPRYIKGSDATRSEVSIPLIVRNEVVGVLDMQSNEREYFDNETIDMLTLFSTQASIALENARLYSLEQRRARQMEAINAVARSTTAVVELDELLENACFQIRERFGVDHVAVALLEDDQLFVRAHQGKLTSKVTLGQALPPDAGLAGRALSTQQAIIENDVSQVSDYFPGFVETRAEMCVPLIFFGEKLGILALESVQVGFFDPQDVQPLESLADICAAAIQNARHFATTKQLAYLDGLTGIFNRRYFEMRIAEELERAQRYTANLAVMMVDIDHFKRLNDEFGHLLGDEVLKQVSALFMAQLRKGDLMCRYGGEEFAMVLPQTTGENAMEVAEKLRRMVETHYFPGVPRPVTISVGVADYPEHGRTRDEIIATADTALYAAKQAGRNRVAGAQSKPKIHS